MLDTYPKEKEKGELFRFSLLHLFSIVIMLLSLRSFAFIFRWPKWNANDDNDTTKYNTATIQKMYACMLHEYFDTISKISMCTMFNVSLLLVHAACVILHLKNSRVSLFTVPFSTCGWFFYTIAYGNGIRWDEMRELAKKYIRLVCCFWWVTFVTENLHSPFLPLFYKT